MNIRSTFLACITFLVAVGIYITYQGQQDRYAVFAQDKAIFVFDRKNATINYCTNESCQLITPHVTDATNLVMGSMPAQTAMVAQSSPQQVATTIMAPLMPPQQTPVPSSLQGAAISQQQQQMMMAVPAGMQAQQVAMPQPSTVTATPPVAAAPANTKASSKNTTEEPATENPDENAADGSDSEEG